MALSKTGRNGNGKTIDDKAENLVNAHIFLYNAISRDGRRLEERSIRKAYTHICRELGIRAVNVHGQPHFTPDDVTRIMETYGLTASPAMRLPISFARYSQFENVDYLNHSKR